MDPTPCTRRRAAVRRPLVCMQAVDQCNTITQDEARRLLNVPNSHNTGNIPGVLPAHAGMMVRLQQNIGATLGLVQDPSCSNTPSMLPRALF